MTTKVYIYIEPTERLTRVYAFSSFTRCLKMTRAVTQHATLTCSKNNIVGSETRVTERENIKKLRRFIYSLLQHNNKKVFF